MIQHFIELMSQGIEVFAVIVIVLGICSSIVSYFLNQRKRLADSYKLLRDRLGKTLLLGLELLVAADIIRTVALTSTMLNILMLALLVAVRTFLSWSLVVEMEGSWPWQTKKEKPAIQ